MARVLLGLPSEMADAQHSERSALPVLRRWVPLLGSVQGYTRDSLRGDVTAGLTVAVMLIPQGMAYAMLAGLPAVVGLYASTAPLVLYALLGTSRQLAVGPVAMVSLMVAGALSDMAAPGSSEYLAYAVVLAALVGGIQLLMGVVRLGFVVRYLSHPVVSGFTSAAALIIGLSQLKHLLGVDIPRSHHVHTVVGHALAHWGDIHPATVALGGSAIAVLLLLKRYAPGIPGALSAVVLGTVAVYALGLNDRGVAIVGNVPSGLPAPSLPRMDLGVVGQLLPTALAISFVGFMESISVAKAFARRHRYSVDANQELIGLGGANLAAALLGGYPVTGGFSRTAVNGQAGARTGVASMLTAAVIALTLVLFTPLFYYLPKAILAAIIMVAVFGLVDLREARHLYVVQRADFLLMLITFAATLVLGIEAGILTGVVVSLLAVLHRISRPRCAVLGRLPRTALYRDVARHPEAKTLEGVLVLRVEAQLYFGNIEFLSDKLRRAIVEASHPVNAVVLNAESINHVDSSAAAGLAELVSELRTERIDMFFASVRTPVLEVMRRSGLVELAGEDHFADSVDRAIAVASTQVGGGETASANGSIVPAHRRAATKVEAVAAPVSGVPAVAAVVPRTVLGPAH